MPWCCVPWAAFKHPLPVRVKFASLKRESSRWREREVIDSRYWTLAYFEIHEHCFPWHFLSRSAKAIKLIILIQYRVYSTCPFRNSSRQTAPKHEEPPQLKGYGTCHRPAGDHLVCPASPVCPLTNTITQCRPTQALSEKLHFWNPAISHGERALTSHTLPTDIYFEYETFFIFSPC